MSIFQSSTDLGFETGLVFGKAGTPYLAEAAGRAQGFNKRKVVALSAANPAALSIFDLPTAVISSREEFSKALNELRTLKPEAILFYGLGEYSTAVLTKIMGGPDSTPQEKDWGTMSRLVAHDLNQLFNVTRVVYATAEVIEQAKTGVLRLNLNHGLIKLVQAHFAQKIYVALRRTVDGSGFEPAVQTDPALAWEFKEPVRNRPNPTK